MGSRLGLGEAASLLTNSLKPHSQPLRYRNNFTAVMFRNDFPTVCQIIHDHLFITCIKKYVFTCMALQARWNAQDLSGGLRR